MHIVQVTIWYTRTAHHIVNNPLKAVAKKTWMAVCAAEVVGQVSRPYFREGK